MRNLHTFYNINTKTATKLPKIPERETITPVRSNPHFYASLYVALNNQYTCRNISLFKFSVFDSAFICTSQTLKTQTIFSLSMIDNIFDCSIEHRPESARHSNTLFRLRFSQFSDRFTPPA